VDVQQTLAAIGEPTRFRIVNMLAEGPRTVGEIATALGALQPQTTKHIQALETAGVVKVTRLGRRRLASLDRATFREIAEWADGASVESEDDRALGAYVQKVAEVTAHAGNDAALTTVELTRRLRASRSTVWRAWTDPELAARWWAPRHFEAVRCEIRPEVGARVELVLREADGTIYTSSGTVREVQPERRLTFDLSPMDAQGDTLLTVDVEVRLEGEDGTSLHLTIRAKDVTAATAPMAAGLEPGWSQQLDRLEALLAPR